MARNCNSEEDRVKACFEFVCVDIQSSWDYKLNPVTCKASDVLKHRTGYCYAKSHLLTALLRSLGIPAGFCYQRLSVSEEGEPYCLHGLNAVYLQSYGWYRIDARGNKVNVNAQFALPLEQLAYLIKNTNERELPEIWTEPLPLTINALTRYTTVDEVALNLPDIELIGANLLSNSDSWRHERIVGIQKTEPSSQVF